MEKPGPKCHVSITPRPPHTHTQTRYSPAALLNTSQKPLSTYELYTHSQSYACVPEGASHDNSLFIRVRGRTEALLGQLGPWFTQVPRGVQLTRLQFLFSPFNSTYQTRFPGENWFVLG